MWGPLSGANQNVMVSAVVPVVPVYVGATINRASAGNGKLDLEFDVNITSPGGDYEAGFTIECRAPSGTWFTLDATKYTAALQDSKYIRFSLTGTVNTFQASHEIRVSYSSTSGDIASAATGHDLATFSNVTTLTNSSTVDLLNGILERYSLDNLVASITSPGNDLTNVNSATFVAGKLGNAASLVRASSQYLDGPKLIPSGNFTILSWIKLSAVNAQQNIWVQGTEGVESIMWLIVLSSNFLSFHTVSGANSAGTTMLVADTWYHCAGRYNGTIQQILLNGAQEDSDAATADYAGDSTHFGANSQVTSFFDGLIDETLLFSRSLADAEIGDHRNGDDGKAWPFIPDYL